jgi:hypothetical protein
MTESEILFSCFERLRAEALPSLGIDDPLLTRIISARLLIERVGERDANYWWDSQVLCDFGQGTLDETVPRTATRSQIELAMKVGRKVENEAIEEEAISLFDFGPFVESQIQREIDAIDNGDGLDILTEQSVELTETGWTQPLAEGEVAMEPDIGTSYELGSASIDDLKEGEVLDGVVSHLISGYGNATKQNLQIPYYSVIQ